MEFEVKTVKVTRDVAEDLKTTLSQWPGFDSDGDQLACIVPIVEDGTTTRLLVVVKQDQGAY